MLREQFIVDRIKRLARGVDGKRQRHAERLAEYRLRDDARVALKHGTLDAIDFDGAGRLQQGGTLRAVVGGYGFSHEGSVERRQNRPKKYFGKPIDTATR